MRTLGTLGTIKLAILVAAVSVVTAAATFTAEKQVMRSSVFEWDRLEAKPTKTGAVRSVFKEPTTRLDELEMHITTLNPGESPHAPHQHVDEELLIVKEGTLETSQNGVARRAGPGATIFQASNEMHGLRNVGQTPATYYVIRWTVPTAGK
jgi:quercetin dioxygenase-like cupin family protein